MPNALKNRPSWEEYALKLALDAANRSEDPYRQVGCCLLRHDHSVAGMGYNGAPSGVTIDYSNRDLRRKFVVHAEINALRYVRPEECGLAAVTLKPCSDCLKAMRAWGIKKVIYLEEYPLEDVEETAQVLGVELVKMKL